MSSNSIKSLPIHELVLDPENPRLPEYVERSTKAIINYIAKHTSIEELITAIGENDYFPGEPVIVYEENGRYIVVEGNRRLAAVLLLGGGALKYVENPSKRLIEAIESATYRPTHIPVIVEDSRESVMPYLGYRHITGVKQWDPLAKARYIKQIFDKTSTKDETEDRFKEVARIIGSRADYIRRSLLSLNCYHLIERKNFYGLQELGESTIKFSVLGTALADSNVYSYVTDENGEFIENKVGFLTRWLFAQDEDGETIVGESRNLRQLSSVLSSAKATDALENGASLDHAYRLTSGSNKEFIQSLYAAEAELNHATSLLAVIDYDEAAIDLAREIRNYISLIGKTLVDLRDKKGNDDF